VTGTAPSARLAVALDAVGDEQHGE
jgi:hypothetical protein